MELKEFCKKILADKANKEAFISGSLKLEDIYKKAVAEGYGESLDAFKAQILEIGKSLINSIDANELKEIMNKLDGAKLSEDLVLNVAGGKINDIDAAFACMCG